MLTGPRAAQGQRRSARSRQQIRRAGQVVGARVPIARCHRRLQRQCRTHLAALGQCRVWRTRAVGASAQRRRLDSCPPLSGQRPRSPLRRAAPAARRGVWSRRSIVPPPCAWSIPSTSNALLEDLLEASKPPVPADAAMATLVAATLPRYPAPPPDRFALSRDWRPRGLVRRRFGAYRTGRSRLLAFALSRRLAADTGSVAGAAYRVSCEYFRHGNRAVPAAVHGTTETLGRSGKLCRHPGAGAARRALAAWR